jgi:hypothetical protein
MTTKTTSKNRSRNSSAKPVQKHGRPGATGRLTREETTNLILQAQEAFHYQTVLGNIEPGSTFDDWRRDQVMDCVSLPGISKIDRSHWRQVKAHFLTLSGREDEAFTLLQKTGPKSYRPTSDQDTWESSETYVALIREALANHAQVPADRLLDGKGHIHTGWFLAAARQRTAKLTLTMDTLAERLDAKTLNGLLAHLVSHINLREGRADLDRRKARSYPSPADSDDPF